MLYANTCFSWTCDQKRSPEAPLAKIAVDTFCYEDENHDSSTQNPRQKWQGLAGGYDKKAYRTFSAVTDVTSVYMTVLPNICIRTASLLLLL